MESQRLRHLSTLNRLIFNTFTYFQQDQVEFMKTIVFFYTYSVINLILQE